MVTKLMQKNTFIPGYQDKLNYLFLVQTLKIVNLNKLFDNSVSDKTQDLEKYWHSIESSF